MRLIDGDYAFKHLRGCVGKYPSTYVVGLLTAADEIAKIPTIEVPRWIPVTERLPEDGQIVLTCKNGICEVQTYEARRNGWVSGRFFGLWHLSPTGCPCQVRRVWNERKTAKKIDGAHKI